jgi:hypothetical protein
MRSAFRVRPSPGLKMRCIFAVLFAFSPSILAAQSAGLSDSSFVSVTQLLARMLPTKSGSRVNVIDRTAALRVLGERGGSAESSAMSGRIGAASRFVGAVARNGRRNPYGADTILHIPDSWTPKGPNSWLLHLTAVSHANMAREEVFDCYLPVKRTPSGQWALDSLPSGRGRFWCMGF